MKKAGLGRAIALALCAVGSATGAAIAQDRVIEVSGEVSCAGCRITMDTVLVLGGLDGPGSHVLEGPVPLAAVDQRGRILVAMWARPDISVFDSTGGFIGELGRAGEGPGEYTFITHLNVGPEFIHVFDVMRGRTLLNVDHGFVRADRFAADVNSAAVTKSETSVFAGEVATSASVGHRLHLLDADGEMHSYGWDGTVSRGRSRKNFAVAANDSAAWIIEGNSGRMEEWTLLPEPKVSRIFNRHVEEFEREKSTPGETAGAWPSASNIGARVNDHGIWILWWTPDPGWTKRTGDPEVSNRWDREELSHTIFDGVLDLIDPETGRTLARHRSDLTMPGFVYGSDMVMAYEETRAGVPYVYLLKPTVHGMTSRAAK